MPVDLFYRQCVQTLNPSLESFSWIPPGHPALAPFDPLLFPWQLGHQWSLRARSPDSNTGGKLSIHDYGDRVQVVVGKDNRPELVFHPVPVGDVPKAANIDYLTFTFASEVFGVGDAEVIGKLSYLLQRAVGLIVDQDVMMGKKNYYKRSYPLRYPGVGTPHRELGFVAIGGNRDTVCVSIKGFGCASISDDGYARLATLLRLMDARITRTDLAYDDFEGIHSVDWALQQWEDSMDGVSNGFKCWGKVPSMNQHGNWQRPDGSGRTIEIGKRKSSKFCRIYEKGKQLGDPESLWTRLEVEFKASDRVIPYDILTNPGSYLAGAYPCLSWVNEAQSKIKMIVKVAKLTYEAMKKNIRAQMGGFVNYMVQGLGLSPEQIIKDLSRPAGIPRRLIVPLVPG